MSPPRRSRVPGQAVKTELRWAHCGRGAPSPTSTSLLGSRLRPSRSRQGWSGHAPPRPRPQAQPHPSTRPLRTLRPRPLEAALRVPPPPSPSGRRRLSLPASGSGYLYFSVPVSSSTFLPVLDPLCLCNPLAVPVSFESRGLYLSESVSLYPCLSRFSVSPCISLSFSRRPSPSPVLSLLPSCGSLCPMSAPQPARRGDLLSRFPPPPGALAPAGRAARRAAGDPVWPSGGLSEEDRGLSAHPQRCAECRETLWASVGDTGDGVCHQETVWVCTTVRLCMTPEVVRGCVTL